LTQQQKEQENLLKTHLESLSKQQKTSSESQEKLLQLRLDSFGQELKSSKEALSQINNLLLTPFKRGRLGNIQLDRLLSLYLPKDDRIYRLEYTLKKKTAKGEGLRPDAVIFGIEQKNNLAIDSKFPFENYLSAGQEGLSPIEEEERTKKFKENLKTHIKKIAEYISLLDHTKHVIMFIPSEVVFAKINEQSYYDIIEFALAKKVSLCSPVTLAIIVNQVLWTNQIHEQYQTMDQSNKALQEFNTSVEKIVKHGEKIREVKTVPNLVQPAEPLASLPEK
ncbi:19118_t:CDS:2, partial [Racocetra fulgida]